MNVQSNKTKEGFTIIEVVLVLAIAALIFLMVFIALPALQRNQRDTARKSDASTVVTALNSYKSNNRGSFGTMTPVTLQKYVDKLGQYEVTDIIATAANTASPAQDKIQYRLGAKCPSAAPAPGTNLTFTTAVTSGVTARNAAVVVRLENGGGANNWQLYCVDV